MASYVDVGAATSGAGPLSERYGIGGVISLDIGRCTKGIENRK